MLQYVLIAYLIHFTYLSIPSIHFISFMKFKYNFFLSFISICLLILTNHGAFQYRCS
jgi:hypothetical protein